MTATEESDESSVEEAVRRFTEAENALRAILAAHDRLAAASGQLDEARSAIDAAETANGQRIEEARAALRRSESALAETSSAVHNLTVELRDIAGDLKDTALAFRRLKPEQLWEELAAIRQTQTRILVGVVLAVVIGAAGVVAALV